MCRDVENLLFACAVYWNCYYVRCILLFKFHHRVKEKNNKDCTKRVCVPGSDDECVKQCCCCPSSWMTEALLSWKYWWPLHPAQRAGINKPCVKCFAHSLTHRLQFHPSGLTHEPSSAVARWGRAAGEHEVSPGGGNKRHELKTWNLDNFFFWPQKNY